MSISSDLKLISDMASRLSIDLEDSPSGSIPVDSWFILSDLLTKVTLVESRLNGHELFFPEEVVSIGTDDYGLDLLEYVDFLTKAENFRRVVLHSPNFFGDLA